MSILNLKLEVESKLNLIPEPIYHNLVLARIDKVDVQMYDVADTDENGNPNVGEYAGTKIPRLRFTLKSIILDKSTDKHDRENIESFGVFTTISKEGVPFENKIVLQRVTEDFSKIIHIHNVLRKHTNTAPIEIEKLNVFDPFAPIAERIKVLTEVYEYLAEKFNEVSPTTNEVQYKDVPFCWVLIPGGQFRTQYVLPRYVGKGFVEVFKGLNHKPAIQVPVNVDMTLGKKDNKSMKAAPTADDYAKGIQNLQFED